MITQLLGTLTVRVLLVAAGLLSSVITARMLGPEGRGIFFYWTTLAALAIQFGNLGLHSSNTFYLAKNRAHFSTLAANSLWVSLVGGGAIGSILVTILWFAGRPLQDEWGLLWPTLIIIPAGLYFLLGTNLFVALQRFSEYNGFELVNRYVGLAVVSLAAWFFPSPESLVAALALVAAFICVPLYHRLGRLGGGTTPSFALFRRGFGYGLRAYLVAVIALFVLRLNTLLLERSVETSTLGVWSIAAQLLDVIAIVPATFALVLFPKLVESSQPYQLMRSQLSIVAASLGILGLLAVLLGRQVILFVYGERFLEAYEILLWGLPGAFGLGLVSILSQYLAATGLPIALLWIWCSALVVEYTLAVLLIPSYGAVGAMAALSLTYLVVLGMAWALAVQTHNSQNHKAQNYVG